MGESVPIVTMMAELRVLIMIYTDKAKLGEFSYRVHNGVRDRHFLCCSFVERLLQQTPQTIELQVSTEKPAPVDGWTEAIFLYYADEDCGVEVMGTKFDLYMMMIDFLLATCRLRDGDTFWFRILPQ
jgi:hypothetical protein